MARIAAFVIGAVSIVLSIFAQNLNVAFLVALAFAVAASGNLPAILYSLFWRRFNTSGRDLGDLRRPDHRRGAGVLLAGGLRQRRPRCSPTTTGSGSRCPTRASSPSRSASSAAGSARCLSKEHDEAKYAELEVRSLTGAGAH